MNIPVTGEAGFTGLNLREKPAAASKKIIFPDNFNDYYNQKIKGENLRNFEGSANLTLYRRDSLLHLKKYSKYIDYCN
jgi:nucleoside-diphosphate-sugar epimerase